MLPLAPEDLLSLERYAHERAAFRARVIAHRQLRRVSLGPYITWSFEDRLTVQYQVQEMLRIERIFEAPGIAEELTAYNPLIPGGANLKATMMIEVPDPDERRHQLARLKDVEQRCWLQVDGCAAVFAVADEDLERTNDEKTSAVHFLRFEFPATAIRRFKDGGVLAAGVDHVAYQYRVDSLPLATTECLRGDLE
jgi:hypothetical protein